MLRISDNIGRTLFAKNGNAAKGVNTEIVNIENFAKGVYHVSITMNDKQQHMILVKD